mmetsp:Transcript_28049/g.64688  ORF Transcript_28049/g.64688 Transcript_28049/m.64688 type:complete len:256 (-) Transcript_28049:1513-2280(-)
MLGNHPAQNVGTIPLQELRIGRAVPRSASRPCPRRSRRTKRLLEDTTPITSGDTPSRGRRAPVWTAASPSDRWTFVPGWLVGSECEFEDLEVGFQLGFLINQTLDLKLVLCVRNGNLFLQLPSLERYLLPLRGARGQRALGVLQQKLGPAQRVGQLGEFLLSRLSFGCMSSLHIVYVLFELLLSCLEPSLHQLLCSHGGSSVCLELIKLREFLAELMELRLTGHDSAVLGPHVLLELVNVLQHLVDPVQELLLGG